MEVATKLNNNFRAHVFTDIIKSPAQGLVQVGFEWN